MLRLCKHTQLATLPRDWHVIQAIGEERTVAAALGYSLGQLGQLGQQLGARENERKGLWTDDTTARSPLKHSLSLSLSKEKEKADITGVSEEDAPHKTVATQTSQWLLPRHLLSAAEAEEAEAAEQRKVFYWSERTGESTWAPPRIVVADELRRDLLV